MRKLFLEFFVLLLLGVAAVLLWPGNYYVHRALLHTYPKIDQYPIFENRVVKAGDPAPLPYAPGVGERRIPARFEADFSRYGTVAFLVLKEGEIWLEQYWENYGPQSHSNSFSMAKSIISMLVGCAIEDGFIRDVDQPVSDFLPGWGAYEGDTLRIRDLLTMSAGVKWDESSTSLFSTTTEAYYGKDLWSLAQREVLIGRPGVYFNYQSGVTQILAFLLKEATGRNIADYASEKIWTPIQAEEDALWSLDHEDGMEKAYCCFNSNARDFARLGQLVLQDGYWYPQASADEVETDASSDSPGQVGGLAESSAATEAVDVAKVDSGPVAAGTRKRVKVVDSAYLAEATTPATYLKARLDDGREVPCTMYGYQFWKMDYRGYDITYFRGILGQYIFVIPALDAVVVRLGHERADAYNVEQDYPLDIDIWLEAALDLLVDSTYAWESKKFCE